MVRMRAISRLVCVRRAAFSSAPVADWNRRLNSSWRVSASLRSSSSSVSSRSSLALKEIRLPLHDFGFHGQLLAREAKRLFRERFRHAGELEHDAPRLDHRDPALGRALARAHAGLGRLLRVRLVGEDVDPDLAAALDLARHGDTSRLDLPVRDPAPLGRLQAVVAELHGRLALRLAGTAAAMDLAELRLLRHQHRLRLLRLPRTALRLLLRRISRLVELRRILDLLLRSGRIGRVGTRRRHLLDLRLDHGLLAPFGARARVVRARLLHVRVAPGTRCTAAGAAAGRARTRTWAATLAGPSPSTAGAAARAAPPAGTHRAEALAVGAAPAPALTGRAEALDCAAAAALRVLVAEPLVADRDAFVALRHDLALVDPDLHADAAVRRLRFHEAVVDIRANGVKRDAALAVGLPPAHLAAAEAAGALDLHTGCAGADRGCERTLHRAPEGDAVRQLLGDRLRDELRVQLGTLDLVDVDVDVLLRQRVQLAAQRVDLDTGLADDDAGARREDVHGDALLVLLDEDVRQPRVRELLVDVLADLHVLEQVRRELLLARVPVRLPAVDDPHPQAAGMNLLSH